MKRLFDTISNENLEESIKVAIQDDTFFSQLLTQENRRAQICNEISRSSSRLLWHSILHNKPQVVQYLLDNFQPSTVQKFKLDIDPYRSIPQDAFQLASLLCHSECANLIATYRATSQFRSTAAKIKN